MVVAFLGSMPLIELSSATYTSATSDPSNAFGTTSLHAPASATATPGDGTVTVTWTPPSTNPSAVGGYLATASPGGATCSTGAGASTCDIGGLTNGLDYTVSVVATNNNWSGPARVTGSVTPYPATLMSGATLNLWFDGADSSVLVSSSGCTGATATTGQTIGCWKDKSANANHAVQTTSTLRPTVSSLNSRTSPNFDGTDDYTWLDVNKMVLGTNPSAIFVVAVQEDTNPAGSSWRHVIGWGQASTNRTRVVEKGAFDADIHIETYDTWASTTPTKTWPTGSAVLVDGVITSSGFTSYRSGALNTSYSGAPNTGTSSGAALGAAPWSTGEVWKGRIAEIVVLAANPTSAQVRVIREYLARKWALTITPSAPVSPTKNVTGTTATVSWTVPAWNGGAAITSYTVTPVGGPGSCTWSAGTTASCSGLTNGLPYTFTVAATNSVGTGPTATTP